MKELIKRQEFTYWFIPTSIKRREYVIYKLIDGKVTRGGKVGKIYDIDDISTLELIDEAVNTPSFVIELMNDINRYKTRPEYIALDVIRLNNEEPINKFAHILVGGYMLTKQATDPDKAFESAMKAIQWLNTTDFYQAPASTMYHDSFKGGLLHHTLNVVDCLSKLIDSEPFNSVDIGDALVSACCHDWCKIGMYESYMRNVKDEKTGQWKQVEAFKTKEQRFISLGHGVSSMYLASKCFNLNLECLSAIRWHMGEYNVAPNEMNELHQCNEQFPLVQLLQFADRLSITPYGIAKED